MYVGDPLFDASTFLHTWVKAVALQHQRVRDYRSGPSKTVVTDQGGIKLPPDWWQHLIALNADMLMLTLALQQVPEAGKAVHHVAPPRSKPMIAAAVDRFGRTCPDLQVLRNLIVHFHDYLRGAGKAGRNAKVDDYGVPDESYLLYAFITTDNKGMLSLEVDLDEAVEAAYQLGHDIDTALQRRVIAERPA